MSRIRCKCHFSPRNFGVLTLLSVCFWWLLVAPFFQESQLKISIDTEKPDLLQVFWNIKSIMGKQSGYLEKQSRAKSLPPGHTDVTFTLPSLRKIKTLRIDPSIHVTSFTLGSITLSQAGFSPIIVDSSQAVKEQVELFRTRVVEDTDNGIGFESFEDDPQLVLTIRPAFSYLKYVVDKKKEYSKFISQRMDLLGLDWPGLLFLSFDLLLLASISATMLSFLGVSRKNKGEVCLLLGLTGLAVILFAVILLGMSYLLTWQNVLLSHAIVWISLHSITARKSHLSFLGEAVVNCKQIYGELIIAVRDTLFPAERRMVSFSSAILLASILFLLVYFILPAAFTLPLNFDSNDYRLSRVGYWLQEANIWQFPSNDIRQIIMPSNCDLAMLWITSFFKEGYPLVHVVSFFGGVLVCCSIYAISRVLAFSRRYSLVAVLIWLGIPNSASQMLTSQTDLFTTGCLMAGLYCFYQAVRNKKYYYYVYAGIGIGLSVGAKSTVFLWGPGLLFLCLVIVGCRIKELQWAFFAKGILLLLSFFIVLAGFVYGQNIVRYKNFLGPSEVVESIDVSRAPVVKTAGGRQKMSKTAFVYLRAKAYLWQVFEPSSNLQVIRPVTDKGFTILEQDIYKTNKILKASFVSMFRSAASWLRSSRLSEDYVSFGAVVFLLFLLGGCIAIVRSLFVRDSQSIAVSILFVAVLLYMLFFCWVVGWTVHRYRYAILVTPFLAVIGMYALSVLTGSSKKGLRYCAVTLACTVIVYQIAMALNVASNSRSHGWFAFRFPGKVYSYVFYWRDAKHLTDALPEEIHRLGLVLAKGSWKSMFYRTGRDISSYTIPVDDEIDASYAFLEEQHVEALITKKLSSVSIEDSFNLLPSLTNTYQALIPAKTDKERLSWIIPSGTWSDGWVRLRGAVRVGNWKSGVLSLTVCNPAPVDETIVFKSSAKQYEMLLDANSECKKLDIPVNDNDYISWRIEPGYHPWKNPGAKEVRSLGVKIRFPKPE